MPLLEETKTKLTCGLDRETLDEYYTIQLLRYKENYYYYYFVFLSFIPQLEIDNFIENLYIVLSCLVLLPFHAFTFF